MRADERYIRDCILAPRTFTVAGYPPVMPDFTGQIGEDDLMKLVAYIQSLGSKRGIAMSTVAVDLPRQLRHRRKHGPLLAADAGP